MVFEDYYKVVYCDDASYEKGFDYGDDFFRFRNALNYRGYIVHREDGPAIESKDGEKQWWLNGKRHRVNGPAEEIPGIYKKWWFEGKMHRENGPAIEWYDGDTWWWLNGKEYNKQDYWKIMNLKTKKRVLNEI